MTRPVRIQLSRKKGFNLQEHSRAINGLEAMNCVRPGKWGNPFIVGKHGTRVDCVNRFLFMFTGFKALSVDSECISAQEAYPRDLTELRGKNLACFCDLPEPGEPDICHCAPLLELANKEPTDER